MLGAMTKRLLSDEQIVRLLDQVGDDLRDHAGETREGETCLRAVEYWTRAVNEKLVVYVQFRDLRTRNTLDALKRIADQSPRTKPPFGPD